MQTMIPTTRLSDLRAEIDSLHEAEREALEALGEARIRGLPGTAARSELERVRSALEATYAAIRLLQLRGRIR